MAKKKIIEEAGEVKPEHTLILTKRDIDLYRDDNAHLEGIKIENLEIDNYTFRGLSLKDSVFKNVRFKGSKFQGVNFSLLEVVDCVFDGCDLRWVTLTGEQAKNNMFMNCQERELHVIG